MDSNETKRIEQNAYSEYCEKMYALCKRADTVNAFFSGLIEIMERYEKTIKAFSVEKQLRAGLVISYLTETSKLVWPRDKQLREEQMRTIFELLEATEGAFDRKLPFVIATYINSLPATV
jgi:hypothetical protein